MNNHYFIGIKIPLPAARSLVEQRDFWNRFDHKRHPLAEDLHITLLFIGGDPEGEIWEAAAAMEKISHPSFELNITGTGHFGTSARPRVVYAAVEESVPLNDLHQKVKEALKGFNLSPDDKPFVPHITLANKWSGKNAWDDIPAMEPESFAAVEFSLFRIEPAGNPRYIAIKTYNLKDGV